MFRNHTLRRGSLSGFSAPVCGLLLLLLGLSMPAAAVDLHSFTMKDIDGKLVNLADFAGKVVLVVNTASYCGFTGQFADLEAIYQRYKDRGFVVLGFPSNDFLGQDPGSDAEIKAFCTTKYQVSFPMFSKTPVTGNAKNPLYSWLTDKVANPKTGGEITWNFNKFLIGKNGKVAARYDSAVRPDDKALTTALEALLKTGI